MKKILFTAAVALAFMFCLAAESNILAQGRGNGGGGGRGNGVGRPATVGVDRGLGNASIKSNGRSDDGLSNASTKSNGRSTGGLDRARLARIKANEVSDGEINRFRGLSRKLGTTPEQARARYEAALLANPDLNYGQFVAAHMVADNLGRRNPNITAANILLGYQNGDSLGRTLRNLRLTKEQAKIVENDVKMRMDAARGRH
jgi:hypothetical protein